MAAVRVVKREMRNSNQWSSQADNPFETATTLHPNSSGDISASWLLDGYPFPGAALLSGVCVIGDPARVSSVILDISIRQGEMVVNSTYELRNGQPNLYGVGFLSDGSPYELTFSARVSDPKDFPGSVFIIGPIHNFSPIGDSERPFLHMIREGQGGALVSCNQGGLMNRIIPLMSLILIGKQTGRPVYSFWGKNLHCAAALDDIFERAPRIDLSPLSNNFQRYENYEDVPPLDLGASAESKLIYSIRPINTIYPTVEQNYDDIAQEFKEQELSLPIRRELSKFDGVDFSKTIALHIRRPFPNGAFAEQEQAKFTLSLDVFMDLIGQLKSGSSQYNKVLLCTNSPEFEGAIKDRFGNFIMVYEKETIDNTTNPQAVQSAVVDIMLMSRCPIMFSQETTAFGHFAHTIGRNKLLCITKKTTSDNFHFWEFRRGVHVDEFQTSRVGLGTIQDHMQ
jgi:hypothetical protein